MGSQRITAYLPPGLVSPNALADIRQVIDWLPTTITNCCGFELQLNQESSSADFAFLCKRNSDAAQIFGGTSTTVLRKELLENAVWANLGAFCRSWIENEKKFGNHINHFWVEIDIQEQQDVPVPNVFLGISQKHPPDVDWLAPVLETFNYPVSNRFLRRLETIIQMPAFENRMFQLGLMFSRKTNLTRLVVHNVKSCIFEALSGLGVENRELQDVLNDLLRVTSFVHLSFDIGESVGPKIGIECQHYSGSIWNDQPRWAETIHHLVSLSCCTPFKADAVLQWPGRSVETSLHRSVPVLRSINHFKVDWQQGAPLNAKAYLLIQYF